MSKATVIKTHLSKTQSNPDVFKPNLFDLKREINLTISNVLINPPGLVQLSRSWSHLNELRHSK